MARHNELGKWGEEQAAAYLERQGYSVLYRDWRVGHRDVDLIALSPDETIIAFIEVKTRESEEIRSAMDAVTVTKIRSIGIAANEYIKEHHLDQEFRFDIITVVGNNNSNVKIEHVINAFNPCMV
jgi:putative endonuclease